MGQRRRMGWAAILLAFLITLGAGATRVGAATDGQNYKDAQYVQITLGFPNQQIGLRQVEDQPDGLTEPVRDGTGRRTMSNTVGPERFIYFDVDDTYIQGGVNKVVMTITYLDRGLTPFFLEYDSFDTVRPDSKDDAVTRKRVTVSGRSNTEEWRTARLELADARFGNNQPGGADFRLMTGDELIVGNVSVLLLEHQEPLSPLRVVLDGTEILFDVLPFVDPQTNRTLVPMRAIFNALGIPNTDIYWDGEARRVEARKGQTTIMLTIDQAIAQVNGRPVLLDQPAVIRADRTLAPLRFVSEQFGLQVAWNAEERLITLTSPPPVSSPSTGPVTPP